MKIYVDFNDLDAEDLPSSISNKYKLQVRSINGGSDYNCQVVSLAEHDREKRNELIDEILERIEARDVRYINYDADEYALDYEVLKDVLNEMRNKENEL